MGSLADMDRARHAEERGQILQALAQEFGKAATSVRALASALDLVGYPMAPETMQFHLSYLGEQKYVVGVRFRDTPLWRADREQPGDPERVVTARLTVTGLQLVDGVGPADPMVTF
jgi:hypothetical protein